jgi:hypothetical protein
MRITNKRMPEDVIINFKAIYKDNSNGEIVYHFATNDLRYNINYFLDSETNDSIVFSFQKDEKNSITYIYTLARL